MWNTEKYANKYGKPDLERLGLFTEMPYMPQSRRPNVPRSNPTMPNFLTSPMKAKCGNQDGYFQRDFQRAFVGEAPKPLKKKAIKYKMPFLPAGPGKAHSTPNDFYGTFEKTPVMAVSPRTRKVKKSKRFKPNMITNPPKLGGCGYIDITLGKYPQHESDRYASKEKKIGSLRPFYSGRTCGYFDKNPYVDSSIKTFETKIKTKADGKRGGKPIFKLGLKGDYDGYFTKYPVHMPDRPKKIVTEKPRQSIPFSPASNLQNKTKQFKSVLENTDMLISTDNYQSYQPQYVEYL